MGRAVQYKRNLITLNLEHVAHELSVLLVVFDDEDQLAGGFQIELDIFPSLE